MNIFMKFELKGHSQSINWLILVMKHDDLKLLLHSYFG